jgi:hypothetical protein
MTDIEKIQKVAAYIEYAETRKKQYGFLIRNGRSTFQEAYRVKSKRDPNKWLYKYKSMPIPKNTKENDGFRLDDAEISFQKHVGVYRKFNNDMIESVVKNDSLMGLQVENRLNIHYYSFDKNRALWANLKQGFRFYEIDIAKAYFQSAYRLGYITKKTYNLYSEQDGYKQAMREAITWLGTAYQKQYYNIKGLPKEECYTIKCDIKANQRIYDNVRNTLHNFIFDAVTLIGWDDFIYYTIDSVAFAPDKLHLVKKLFDDNGWQYKVRECYKLNETTYIKDNQERKF